MKKSRSFATVFTVVVPLLLASCGGGSNSSITSNPPPPATPSYELTVTAPAAGQGTITSSPAGISCPGTCSATYTQNTNVTLTATPGSNFYFGGWSGGCSGASSCSLTMNAAATVGATFNAGVQVSVSLSGSGSGTITSSPAGINCTSSTSATCSAGFPPNTQLTLSATPGSNFYFGGWSGACSGAGSCALTLTTATSVGASFTSGVPFTVSLAGMGQGTITSSPAGINCSTSPNAICTAAFPPATQVSLTESPAQNNVFAGWSGACSGNSSCSVTLSAPSAVTATFGGTLKSSINHIILFAQENRSFDHYFGYMRQYWANNGIPDQSFDGLPQFNPTSGAAPLYGNPPTIPGCELASDADGCTPDVNNPISSFSFHSVLLPSGKKGTMCEENQSPFWNEAHNQWDYTNPTGENPPNSPAKLNGFVFTAAYDAKSNNYMDFNGVRAMGYYQDADLNFYYYMATQFATSDRWFSPLMDRTQLNRAYIFSGTTQGYAYPINGGVNDSAPFSAKTIFEAMQNAGLSWKIYVNPVGTSYNGVNCETATPGQQQDLCLAGVSYMNGFTYESKIQNPANGLWQHFAPVSQFAIDLQNEATFPQFAYIEPASNAGFDEHPSDADQYPENIQTTALYVENTIINPFLQSPTYSDSAMIFTYDEAGGLYDHVPPQPAAPPGDYLSPIDLNPALNDICTGPGQLGSGMCTFGWTGYRVPLIVISPYTIKNFVSHTQRDTTAVLKMVEDRFGLPALTNRDASQVSMDEFFDYVNKPQATPPTPPTQSTSGRCDQTPAASWNEPPKVQVTVTGGGTVLSSPSGINNCSASGGPACSSLFSTNQVVTLTATPNSGSTFTGWSGGGFSGTSTCMLIMNSNTPVNSITATFNP